MGFWGAAEEAVVNAAAGSVGMAEVVPVVGLAANAAAAGIHDLDAAGHAVAAGYDSITGDDKGADEQMRKVGEQGADAVAAAIPYVGVAAGATDLLAAGGDAAAAGMRAAGASDAQAPLMPTIGSTVMNAAAPPAEKDPGQMSVTDLYNGLTK